jgi:UTP--glucose-1-phosphate uridylyltransferase
MIRKCLFPVAGYGTRLLPATKAIPKEMFPIVDKPLVQYGVEEALEARINDICFVTSRGKSAIADHFDVNEDLDRHIFGTGKEKALAGLRALIAQCRFSYTRQMSMNGLGDAILKGRCLVGEQPFAVVLADDLCFGSGAGVLSQMVNLFERCRCSIVAVENVPIEHTIAYGVVAGHAIGDRVYRVSGIVEKPAATDAPSNLAVVGR